MGQQVQNLKYTDYNIGILVCVEAAVVFFNFMLEIAVLPIQNSCDVTDISRG